MAVVRAWPHEWAVAWVAAHVSLNEQRFLFDYRRGDGQALLQLEQFIWSSLTFGLAFGLMGGIWLSSAQAPINIPTTPRNGGSEVSFLA